MQRSGDFPKYVAQVATLTNRCSCEEVRGIQKIFAAYNNA
jgi:hypothetical protein